MHRHGWMAPLLALAACTAPPDVVAIQAASAGGESTSGGATGMEAGATAQSGDDATLVPLTGAVDGRDPSGFFDGNELWIVTGGAALSARRSPDLAIVDAPTTLISPLPAWVAEEVPNAQTFWSPDLAHFGGLYHLYYAVSTLGDSRSCIGHATTDVLTGESQWLDQGPLLCSRTSDDFNAIDPSVLVASDGKVWMVLGSYLTGIKLLQLDTTGAAAPGFELVDVAARPEDGGALQAPAIAQHGDYFYLFVSFNTDTAHRLVVGRATSIEGPYVDRTGRELLDGGGDALWEADARFLGPGSNDVFWINERAYNVFHAYDEEDAGRAKLRLATLKWSEDGWPVSGGP